MVGAAVTVSLGFVSTLAAGFAGAASGLLAAAAAILTGYSVAAAGTSVAGAALAAALAGDALVFVVVAAALPMYIKYDKYCEYLRLTYLWQLHLS